MTCKEKLVDLLTDVLGDSIGRKADYLISNGVTVQKWIPVSEEIPEQYQSVIGWTRFKEMGEVMHDGKQFVWTDEESVPAFVTHWMPLPEPPKEVVNHATD
jgi:hypothetical protein